MSTSAPYNDDEVNASFSPPSEHDASRRTSIESTSTTSLILERIHPSGHSENARYDDPESEGKEGEFSEDDEDDFDPDLEHGHIKKFNPMEGKVRRAVYIIGGLLIGGWLLALAVYLSRESYRVKDAPHDPAATATTKAGRTIRFSDVQSGMWLPRRQGIEWIQGKKDGLMMVPGASGGYLQIQDVSDPKNTQVLMRESTISYNGNTIEIAKHWPSPDLKHVLLASHHQRNWRHSFTATYWILHVDSQKAEPLVPNKPDQRLALAKWAPTSDAIAFVQDNNIRIRKLDVNDKTTRVTKDGSKDLFYGRPDWVYEEEVFAGDTALWWSEDGKHLAFLRTNETEVPEYPLQYFVSRPSGYQPPSNLKNYPELDFIKYPKAGAPNPIVNLQFYNTEKDEIFTVDIKNDFADNDRLITEVVWAGSKQVLVRETNRESDVLRMSLIDVEKREGKVVQETDVNALDGGWLEVTQHTKYIPADPNNGREHDGYIDTVIHEGYDHLAYFSPLDAQEPTLLTKGKWEVVDAPSGIDLKNNLVYFVSTERSPIERHVYSVKLDGTDMKPLTNTSEDGRYDVSFSKEGGYALLSYNGPGIPWQKVIGTPAVNKEFTKDLEKNEELKKMVSKYELPTFHYSTVTIDGFELQVVERRPPHFNPKKKYPVLFHLYGGPASQTVSKAFNIDFQSYVAADLEYLVVTVDGRGTGFIGRKARCAIRGNIGYYESRDQIETAKIWGEKKYVDKSRMAIWGWSYGGFLTLKTLEQDAGRTFQYGVAVAPVTDWRYYDSIYTERYMHMPQHNEQGYENATISNVTALAQNVRFMFMHGVADDNVHFQNSLTLLDRLDLAGVENYDVHVFPDSDHSIYFHNANDMVYDRIKNFIIRAFNGEFLKLEGLRPIKNTVVTDVK